ncbi:hypothetical protein Ancab_025675 [Ancistrocladus abbreviatus]
MSRACHLAIYYKDSCPLLDYTSTTAQQIKSLSFYNSIWNPEIMSVGSKQIKDMLRKFKLLWVLHLRHSFVYFPKQLGNLIHLRYLSVEGRDLKKMPSSISNLSFEGNELLQLDGLTNLETLSNFYVNQCRVENLLELPNLRKFSMKRAQYILELKFRVIHESLSFHLGYLKCSSLGIDGEILKKRPRMLFVCHHLRKLWVEGGMSGLQSTHMLPENLTMLSLHETKIKSDPMPILEKLQYLSHLELLSKSYMGKEMVCSVGGFPSLVNLELTSLNIEDWTVEQGAMPNLVRLKICNCRCLKMIPQGLKNVSGLQQVKIEIMPNSLYDRILTGHDQEGFDICEM